MAFSTHKYGAQRSKCTLGHSHRSKLESSVCAIIGKDPDLELVQAEEHVYLSDAEILYIADFKVRRLSTGLMHRVEAKGYESPTWPIKKKLYKTYGELPLHIYKGSYTRPFLDEVIIPKNVQKYYEMNCGPV
jgi:hypothetical protein